LIETLQSMFLSRYVSIQEIGSFYRQLWLDSYEYVFAIDLGLKPDDFSVLGLWKRKSNSQPP